MKRMQTSMRLRRLLCALLAAVLLASAAPAAPGMFVQTAGAAAAKSATTAKSVRLNKTKLTLYNGASYQLQVRGTKAPVLWSSTDKKVATVKNGKVTTKGAGTAVIVARVGGKQLKCRLVVKPILTTDVTSLTIKEGKKKPVGITFLVSGFVKYELKNSGVATCKWGKWDGEHTTLYVIGKHAGATTLVLTNTESSDRVTIKIRVKSSEPALSTEQSAVSLQAGTSTDLIVLAREYGDLTCTVADGSVASAAIQLAYSYDQFRLTLTGKAPGKTVVTVKNKSTGSKLTISVTVTGAAEESADE